MISTRRATRRLDVGARFEIVDERFAGWSRMEDAAMARWDHGNDCLLYCM